MNIEPTAVPRSPLGVRAAQWSQFLDTHGSAQFLLALVVIVAVKWQTLLEPPVWDTAMGLFPAALTLSANNFDLLDLLAMPAFLDGGPNVHSLSPVTLMTALVLQATGGGGPPTFLVLHLLHFVVAAHALVVLFGFSKPVFGKASALLFCLAVLLFPVFSVQVGYMYLEVPLFLCAVSALRAWTDQRFWQAVLWATGAFAVKETGIIVPATLGIFAVLDQRNTRLKAKRVAMIMAPPLALMAITLLLSRLAGVAPGARVGLVEPLSLADTLRALLLSTNHFLLKVPDLWALLILFPFALAAFGPEVLRTLRREPTDPLNRDPKNRAHLVLGYSGTLSAVFILMSAVVLPVSFSYPLVLPRYSVMIAPFLLLWFGYACQQVLADRLRSATVFCFALLSVFFAVNSNGVLYPSDIDSARPGNDPSLTERSNAYRRLLVLEREAIHALEELPDGVPVYYGIYEHYLFKYPGLGFADQPLSNGHNFNVESLEELIEEEPMPPCIYALYNNPWLGGEKIRELIAYADSAENLSSELVQEFRDGRYVISLVRIQQRGVACPR